MWSHWKKPFGLIFGPAAALALLLFADLDPGNPAVTRTAAVALLMAVWWITEAIPIPATALLPVALYPALGIMQGNAVASMYFNNIIFLFIGGFIMALAMERWNLHRRIALRIILLIGASPKRILAGFMTATFFLSMWISNTATAMMMIPMALAIIFKLDERYPGETGRRFAPGLLLGIAYAASVGGMATLIGTPPNLAFARIYAITYPDAPEISFAQWIIFALPLAVVFAALIWLVLTAMFSPPKGSFKEGRGVFREERRAQGPMTYEQKVISVLFVLLAALWMFRIDIPLGAFTIPGWSRLLPEPGFVDDGTVAIFISLLLFLIPARSERAPNELVNDVKKSEPARPSAESVTPGAEQQETDISEARPARTRLMNWRTALKLHWGIVLLFGGGFALAAGFEQSGLSAWAGDRLIGLRGLPTLGMVAATCTSLTFLTELTSNTATTQIMLPILTSISGAIQIHPLMLMIPATLSASCAFMLPVATPPNAIVFGSGRVSMDQMMRVGLTLNLIGIVLITTYMYLLAPALFAIDLSQLPSWAK